MTPTREGWATIIEKINKIKREKKKKKKKKKKNLSWGWATIIEKKKKKKKKKKNLSWGVNKEARLTPTREG